MNLKHCLIIFLLCIITNNTKLLAKAPILEAIKAGNTALVEEMLSNGQDINGIYDNETRFGTTLICYASCLGNIDMVGWLLDKGATVTVKENYLHDALKEAIKCQQAQMTDWFLNTDFYGGIPEEDIKSFLYLSVGNDDVPTFNILLNRSPSMQNPEGYTDLMFSAAINRKFKLFVHLVDLGADIYAPNHKGEYKGESVMHVAANSQPILEYLISRSFDASVQSPSGQVPLHLCHDAAAAAYLITQGVDTNAKDNYGWTPMHYAAFDGDVSVVEVLLQNGGDPNIKTEKKFDTIYPNLSIDKGSITVQIVEAVMVYHKDDAKKSDAYQKIMQLLQ